MKHLDVSRVFQTVSSGDRQFNARKVRSIHFNGLLDPLIGFDHFELTADVFGPHPHAGMSALSYLFEDSGHYHHLDSTGTDVIITPGSLMWTCAGRGVVHTEFPVPEGARVHGIQVFLNTAAIRKQHLPLTLFIESRDMPVAVMDGTVVKVAAGRAEAAANPVKTPDHLTFLDVRIASGNAFRHNLPAGWSATVYVVSGDAIVANGHRSWPLAGGQVLAASRSYRDEELIISATSDTRLIFLSARPLGEPIYSAGSIAMGSEEELGKAISDFEEGHMGFIRVEGDVRTIVLAP
ncbi:pirin family protein [Dyadobacter fermentans]|uniref:pirin family protein n=1 Tax=Dyadobacter fermentans TaxID=94254 RepID=UPI001CBD41D6|nr:pirin-like C-terminal cupin domain-containing protein [Dyadobacter fermentans]MBZ1363052.1 pirin family protein [Dyadobacter fermentans]